MDQQVRRVNRRVVEGFAETAVYLVGHLADLEVRDVSRIQELCLIIADHAAEELDQRGLRSRPRP
jgi:hypothetical protein